MIDPTPTTVHAEASPAKVPGRVCLIGYRGSGKTSVAKILAGRLQCRIVDTDAAIRERIGMTIADFFRLNGEAEFRRVESEVIQQVCLDPSPVIISLGGGAVLLENNRRCIQSGLVVWLDAQESELARRLQGDTATSSQRPSLTAATSVLEEIAAVMAIRRPLYSALSDHRIDTTDRSLADICESIGKLLAK